ncbi:MAG: hypothetical protein ACKO9A_08355, partial [Alphaproteobacteria bacterium]
EAARLRVRPGLFGLAPALGLTSLPWAHRLGFDVQYARQTADFMTDFKLIFACCALLLRGHGAAMPGHATSARLDESLMQDATTMLAGGKG